MSKGDDILNNLFITSDIQNTFSSFNQNWFMASVYVCILHDANIMYILILTYLCNSVSSSMSCELAASLDPLFTPPLTKLIGSEYLSFFFELKALR